MMLSGIKSWELVKGSSRGHPLAGRSSRHRRSREKEFSNWGHPLAGITLFTICLHRIRYVTRIRHTGRTTLCLSTVKMFRSSDTGSRP